MGTMVEPIFYNKTLYHVPMITPVCQLSKLPNELEYLCCSCHFGRFFSGTCRGELQLVDVLLPLSSMTIIACPSENQILYLC